MKLAIDVAEKCSIESEPAWAAWGLSLLKMGRYTEAKDKFNFCLGTLGRLSHSSVSPTENKISNVDTGVILASIIEVLESPPPPDHTLLRTLHNQLAITLRTSGRNSYNIHQVLLFPLMPLTSTRRDVDEILLGCPSRVSPSPSSKSQCVS